MGNLLDQWEVGLLGSSPFLPSHLHSSLVSHSAGLLAISPANSSQLYGQPALDNSLTSPFLAPQLALLAGSLASLLFNSLANFLIGSFCLVIRIAFQPAILPNSPASWGGGGQLDHLLGTGAAHPFTYKLYSPPNVFIESNDLTYITSLRQYSFSITQKCCRIL